MWKRTKITAIMVIAMIVFIVLVGLYSLLFLRYDGFSRTDQAKLELDLIGMIVKKLTAEDKLTPDVWRKINRMDDLAPLVGPMIEGNDALIDPWHNQYLLEKREENGGIIITIRSSHQLERNWFEWKRKVLGIEIVVTGQQGKDSQTHFKTLWHDD